MNKITVKCNTLTSLHVSVSQYDSELILGFGGVIIRLFLQYWPKISSSLRSYFRSVPRYGAFSVILCVFLVTLFTFQSLESILFV